jgi:hypothetical protein
VGSEARYISSLAENLELRKARGLSIECQGMGAPGPDIQSADQGILEVSDATLQCERSIEYLLLVLDLKSICCQKVLDVDGNLRGALF